MTLTEFLEARLADDEAAAKLAAREGGTWTQDDPGRYPGAISSLGGQVVYDEGAPDENQAPHIARHDPARVLREVDAKRKIVADCERDLADDATDQAAHWRLSVLAEIYSDHPDYDESWRP